MATIVALHGFLGRGSDWERVRAESKADLQWICPDLFATGASPPAPPAVDGPCWLAGYSFGARLALRWMNEAPEKWLGALLLSANPGNFQNEAARAARRAADNEWARSFRQRPWDEVMTQWDAQEVFRDASVPARAEAGHDREKLASAMEKFSVGAQFTDLMRLSPRLTWMAGAKDAKFCTVLDDMRDAGFPGVFLRVGGAGHRILHEAPRAVASALDDLVA